MPRGHPVKVVYIGGYSRSGSTLLLQLLSGMPAVTAIGELHDVWRRSLRENQLCGCGLPFHDCPFWSAVIQDVFGTGPSGVRYAGLERRRMSIQGTGTPRGWPGLTRSISSALQTPNYLAGRRSYVELLGRLYTAVARAADTTTIIDSSKVPQYAWLLRSSEDLKVHMVHLVRDSRASAHSWRRVKVRPEVHWRTEYMARHSLLRSAVEWAAFNRLLARRRELYASYTLLRYEDLVDDPAGALREIGRAVGEEWPVDSALGRLTAGSSCAPHTASGNPVRFQTGPLHLRRDDAWQWDMPVHQQALVSAVTATGLRRYGYPLRTTTGGASSSVRSSYPGELKSPDVANGDAARAGELCQPKRLLMVSARYPPFIGGTELHVAEVARRLAARGHDVSVLTTELSGGQRRSEMRDGVRVITVPAWPAGRDWYFAPAVVTEVRRARWDVVHCQGYHTFVAPLGMLAALTSRQPYVVTFHSGGHDSRLRRLARPVQRRVLRGLLLRADHLVAVSDYEADFFARKLRLPEDRLSVISNGVSADFRPRSGPPGPEHRLICSLGRLERYKGHHRLIAALPELHRRDPSIRLVLVGAGDYGASLERQVDRLGLRHLVEFRSSAIDRREEISTLLGQASLVVSLSEYESQGVAVLEALAVGSPVLVNDATAFRQLGAAGLVNVVPPNCSSHTLAEIVLHCLQQDSVVPPQVPPTWEATTDALEALYEFVLQRARGRNREQRRGRGRSALASAVRHAPLAARE